MSKVIISRGHEEVKKDTEDPFRKGIVTHKHYGYITTEWRNLAQEIERVT